MKVEEGGESPPEGKKKATEVEKSLVKGGEEAEEGGEEDSCAGYCGDAAPSGCWCDEQCSYIGDCCEDVCDECSDLLSCQPEPIPTYQITPGIPAAASVNSCADLLFCMSNCPGGEAFQPCQAACYAGKKGKVKTAYETLINCWDTFCDGPECPDGVCVEEVGACLSEGSSTCEQLHACLYLCPDESGCTTGCIIDATPEAYTQFENYQGCILNYCDDFGWLMPETCLIAGHLMCVDEALECGYGIEPQGDLYGYLQRLLVVNLPALLSTELHV